MDDGLQQFFVAEYDGCPAPGSNALWRKPLTDIACLNVLRRGRDIIDCLWRNLLGVLIEDGLAFLLETAEERLLHLLQQVEAHEGIGIVFELDAFVGSHLTIKGTLIGELLTGKAFVERLIDIADVAPQAQETLFEFRVVILGEVAEESAYHLPLFVGEI